MISRIGEMQEVIDALNRYTHATPEDIADTTGIPYPKLNSGMLHEMSQYDIVQRVSHAGGGTKSVWTAKQPTNIEQLKDDMLGAKA